MKRIVTAVLLASLAAPALALEIAPPYSQLNIDRQLPDVKDPVIEQASSGGTSSKEVFGLKLGQPYEQAQLDRALPDVKDPVARSRSVQVAGPASGISFTEATGPWANDWNFIAPAP